MIKRLELYSENELKKLAKKINNRFNHKISTGLTIEILKLSVSIRKEEQQEKKKINSVIINDEILDFANKSRLGVRSYNSLISHYREKTINQLIKDLETKEIMNIKGVGEKTTNELVEQINRTFNLNIEKIRK